MKTICPKCKKYQDLEPSEVLRATRLNEVKRFTCTNCGFTTETVYEQQGKDTIVVFYAMSKIKKDK